MLTPQASDPGVGHEEALSRMTEAEDILRAIGAGEVDAFVVAANGPDQRVFTLETADRPYRMFVENMRDGAATVSPSGIILYANQRLGEMLACTREALRGTPLARFLGEPAPPSEARAAGGGGTTVEFTLVDANGADVPVLIGTSVLDVDGTTLTCMTFTDLSAQRAQDLEIARLSRGQAEQMRDLQQAQAALIEQATHDPLTGLPNRALLVDRIDRALLQSRRTGRCTVVLFVDLDRFKRINDRRGHAEGDVVLRRVARQLVETLRPMDTVCRLGGDEFVILAPEVDGRLHAAEISRRLVAEVGRSPEGAEDGEAVTASVGVSVSVAGRGTAESLLDEADTAMYQAKALGGGRAEGFDLALGRRVSERSAAERRLLEALDERRVVVHFQPIVELAHGRVGGFEALARIRGRDGSILAPSEFIPAAEDSGLVVRLGAQVLAAACEEAARWTARPGFPPVTVAVNIASRQFDSGDLVGMIDGELARTGLTADRLTLELTETAVIDMRPDIVGQLHEIRNRGVQIGLDDFGTGFASLTHLRHLPLTFVKIDQSFVQGLETDGSDARIVSAVVNLAAGLGLASIAEGVETPTQLGRLRELGCGLAQGYLFGRPDAAAGVAETLRRPGW